MQGCDCYGLVQLVLKEHYDIVLPDVGGYVNALDTGQTSSVIDVNTPLLSGEKQTEPSEGLVVVLSSLEGLSSHVGLLVTDKLMLHTTKQFGTIIEPITRNKIKNRIKGLYNVNKSYNTNKSI
jgi:cell wall-associated NlpC family hydrolase